MVTDRQPHACMCQEFAKLFIGQNLFMYIYRSDVQYQCIIFFLTVKLYFPLYFHSLLLCTMFIISSLLWGLYYYLTGLFVCSDRVELQAHVLDHEAAAGPPLRHRNINLRHLNCTFDYNWKKDETEDAHSSCRCDGVTDPKTLEVESGLT